MNNIKNNVSNSVNGLWEEITMNENNINATQVNNEEETTMNNFEEWKNENKGEDFERKMEEMYKKVKEIHKKKKEYTDEKKSFEETVALAKQVEEENEMNNKMEKMYKKVKEIHKKKKEYTDEKKSFEETVALAKQVGVEDEKILKNKVDIDNYFMPVGADTKDNYEEENEMNLMDKEEWNEMLDSFEEGAFEGDNELNFMTDEELDEWMKEREFERKLEGVYKKVKEIRKKKKEYKDPIKSFEETVALAQQVGVADEKILKDKEDIDNYFGVDAKDNPEEETTMNNANNTSNVSNYGPWEEITVEAETKEDSFDASSLIHRGNILIACPSSLYAYKEAIVLLRDVEGAIDKTGSYTTKLSLESIKDGLMNLIAKYEDTSGTTGKKKQLDKSILAEKVAGFKEVTAEKVSVLKEITSEKVSQAKTAVDSIDEDNEYYQKGVEVTEKAKKKYNEVLGNVFNRLKL